MQRSACLLAALCAGTLPAPAAMSVLNYDADLHDRFDSASFIGSAYDLSGIGRSSDGLGRWATMISSEYFISANHFHPGVGSTITFHEDNASGGTTVTRTVLSGSRIGGTDIWLGRLDSALPGTIQSYEIAGTTVDLSSTLGSYADSLVFQVGLRDSWTVGGTTNFVLAQNRIDIGDSTSEELGTFDTIGFIRDQPGDNNLVDPGESFFITGDSGAPSFLDVGGSLVLVGLHVYTIAGLAENDPAFGSFVESQSPDSAYGAPGIQTRDISYDSFLPNERNAILGAAGLPVPEPAHYALGAGMVALLLAARRRR